MTDNSYYNKIISKAIEEIEKHEGLRLKPYKCTGDKWTIGWGRNIQDNGITREEADYLCLNDVRNVVKELKNNLPFFDDLSDKQKIVLIDMCFNLGITRLLKFRKMLTAFHEDNTEGIVEEMKDSRWYKQVGRRAENLINMIKQDRQSG